MEKQIVDIIEQLEEVKMWLEYYTNAEDVDVSINNKGVLTASDGDRVYSDCVKNRRLYDVVNEIIEEWRLDE